jgi:YVTN family beta-propeller protein
MNTDSKSILNYENASIYLKPNSINFSIYSFANFTFSDGYKQEIEIEYPFTWSVEERIDKQISEIFFRTIPENITDTTQDYLKLSVYPSSGNLKNDTKIYQKLKNLKISPYKEIRLDKSDGLQYEYQYQDQNYGDIKVLRTAILKNEYVYKLDYFSQESRYNQYLPTINKIINSFKVFDLAFYENSNLGIKFEYPVKWKINEILNNMISISTYKNRLLDNSEYFEITMSNNTHLSFNEKEQFVNELLDYKIKSLNVFPNLKKIETDSIKYNGYIAKFAKLSFDNLELKQKMLIYLMILSKNDKVYEITYVDKKQLFEKNFYKINKFINSIEWDTNKLYIDHENGIKLNYPNNWYYEIKNWNLVYGNEMDNTLVKKEINFYPISKFGSPLLNISISNNIDDRSKENIYIDLINEYNQIYNNFSLFSNSSEPENPILFSYYSKLFSKTLSGVTIIKLHNDKIYEITFSPSFDEDFYDLSKISDLINSIEFFNNTRYEKMFNESIGVILNIPQTFTLKIGNDDILFSPNNKFYSYVNLSFIPAKLVDEYIKNFTKEKILTNSEIYQKNFLLNSVSKEKFNVTKLVYLYYNKNLDKYFKSQYMYLPINQTLNNKIIFINYTSDLYNYHYNLPIIDSLLESLKIIHINQTNTSNDEYQYYNGNVINSLQYPKTWNITIDDVSVMQIEPKEEENNTSYYNTNPNYISIQSFSSQGSKKITDIIGTDVNYLKLYLDNLNITSFQEIFLSDNSHDAYNITYTHNGDKLIHPSLDLFKTMSIYVKVGLKVYLIHYQTEIDKFLYYLTVVNNIINSLKFETEIAKTNNKSGILLDSSPVDVAVNPTTNKIYIGIPTTDKIYVLDGSTNTIISNITINGVPNSLVINPNTNTIYVASQETDKIYVIDGFNNTVIKSIQAGPIVNDMAIDSNEFGGLGSLIFVANQGADTGNSRIDIIDGITNEIIGNISTGVFSYGIGIDETLNRAYVTNTGSNDIDVIDYATTLSHDFFGKKIDKISVGSLPTGITVNPQNGKVYVTNSGENTISIIDPVSTNKSSLSITVGMFPNSLALNPKDHKLYVANSGEHTISIIDTNSNKVIRTKIPVDSVPYDVALNSETNLIYVANYESNTLSTINGESNKLSAVVNFFLYPENSGKIVCDGKEITVNENIPLRLDVDTNCIAISSIDYEFDKWSEQPIIDNSNRTEIGFIEHIINLYNSLYNTISKSGNKQNTSFAEINITKHGIISANFKLAPTFIMSLQMAGPLLSIFILFLSLISVTVIPYYFEKKRPYHQEKENISKIDILGINAAVIAGVLIFLSLTEGFDVTEQTQITIITANIVFPFAISAILAILNHEKFATRFMIGGFINLIISVILIAIMKL